MNKSNPVYQYVTDKVVKAIEAGGVAPWQKPWNSAFGRPMNLITKKPYRGINVFLLAFSGFESPYWLTLKQCLALGGRVKREEFSKKAMVTYWNVRKYRNTATGRREYLPNDAENWDGKSFLLRYYYVYNVEQCEGIPESKIPATTVKTFNPIERCEEIWAGYTDKPEVTFGGDRAAYAPMLDRIMMPAKNAFDTPENYYATLFHEGMHSTGHPNRLNREGVADFDAFGSDRYGKEELVAEMGAAFLCAEAGIENKTVDTSTSYLNAWLNKIKSEPSLLVSAASQAEKAVEYMLGNAVVQAEEESETEAEVEAVTA